MAKKVTPKKRKKTTKKTTNNSDTKKVMQKTIPVDSVTKAVTKPTHIKETIIENKVSDKPKKSSNINFTDLITKIFKVIVSVAVVVGFVWLTNTYIPKITGEEEFDKDETEQVTDVEEVNKDLLAAEDEVLSFENQNISIETNYGEIKASLQDKAAPKTTESFIRLTHRDYFDGQIFHRMVEGPTFSVIQGGDPDGTGTGGASAFGTPIPDELWKVTPETNEAEGALAITNNPEFIDNSLYADFDKTTGTVKYRKGLLIMAKTAAPDSAGSQFFVTLNDTTLPAQYTVFGIVDESSFATLDKITAEVDPVDDSEGDTKDGRPNQEIRIQKVEIL
jgi:peptidyl-prolyl cis-trans isomerase B (cyclophilin B)